MIQLQQTWLNELLFKVQVAPLFYMEYKINSINIYRNLFCVNETGVKYHWLTAFKWKKVISPVSFDEENI